MTAIPILYGLAVSYLFGMPQKWLITKNYMEHKERLAKDIVGRKVVFSGGSGTLFGVRTVDVQRELGLPAVNLATSAGLQIDYILYRAKKVLKADDIIILPLEYSHFIYQGQFHPSRSFYTRTYDSGFFNSLPVGERLSHIFHTTISDLIQSLIEQALFKWSDDTMDKINGNGDVTYNEGNERMEILMRNMRPVEVQYDGFSETVGLKTLKEFNEWCAQNNIKLYVTYANTVFFKEYETERYKNYFKELQGYFRQNNIRTIGTPYDFFFDSNLFYDTQYHLNQNGMKIRTNGLILKMRDLEITSKELKAIEPHDLRSGLY